MKYIDHWDKIKARFAAFWQGECVDRAMVFCTAPKPNAKPLPPIADIGAYRVDPQRIIERTRAEWEQTYFAGDAFPSMIFDLGACSHAGFFKGANYLIDHTVWYFPALENPRDLEFDENSYMLKKHYELVKAFAEDSGGDYMVAMSDCTGNADALAHLIGSEALLQAMIEDPEGVQIGLRKLQGAYARIMTDTYDIVRAVNDGGSGIGWLKTWAPGFSAQMQCDMSVMISAPMFREYIEPELRAQCDLLEYPLYHFDGIEQRRHLDTLLSVPNLRAIQWTQVAGQPYCTDFFDDLRRIQRAGKGLLIILQNNHQIEPIMENLSAKGLYLQTFANTPEEADAIVNKVAKLSHD